MLLAEMILNAINVNTIKQKELTMDLNKKEIIYELAKGVHGLLTPQSYGATRRKLIEKQGISEIALYSAVAEHLEENDIHPKKFVNEMLELLQDISDNLFVIKTKDNYAFLRSSFSAISLENSPESKNKFLCNKCFTIKNENEKSKKPNYKNCCTPCYKNEAKASSKRYQEKVKQQSVKTEEESLEADSIPESPVQEPQQPTHPIAAPLANVNTTPFIEIESLTGDGRESIVSLSCKTMDLHRLLSLIDPLMILPTEPKSEATPENEEKAEPTE